MNIWRNIIAVILLTATTCGQALWADSSQEPVNRTLQQMSTALRELNYRGLFTYEVGGALDSYKIIHRIQDGIEYERLQKLNGDEREIVRRGHRVNCLSPGDQLLRGILRSVEKSSLPHHHYHFYLTGDQRIADRLARVVHIVPRDQHRFGYSLSVDKKTGLPLQILRVNSDRRVMERIQFIELSVGNDAVDDEEAKAVSKSYREASHHLMDCRAESQASPEPQSWNPHWLPAGFVAAGERQIGNGDYMLSYTDGLATFSIFISPPNSRTLIEGRAQIGASLAYMNQRVWSEAAHSVTVVGEIPFATAQRVVAELEPGQQPE